MPIGDGHWSLCLVTSRADERKRPIYVHAHTPRATLNIYKNILSIFTSNKIQIYHDKKPPLTCLTQVAMSLDTIVHSVMSSHMVVACMHGTCQAGQRSHNHIQWCSSIVVTCIPSASEKRAPLTPLAHIAGCRWDSMHNLINQAIDEHSEVAWILTELCLGMRSSLSYRSAHAILPTNLSDIMYHDCTHLLVVLWLPERWLGGWCLSENIIRNSGEL